MPWSLHEAPSQEGKTILITGANTGIGFATAAHLARKGARVVLACRNRDKGQQALVDLRSELPWAEIELMTLDLANLTSVHRCAEEFLSQNKQLDLLVNNAGVMMLPFGRTADGFETQFGVNVLGHFALTGLLLPILNRSSDARVISLGSVMHWLGSLDFNNLNAEKRYSSFGAYCQSKLANLIFAYELDRRLRRSGSTTISVAAHPGGASSQLGQHHPGLRFLSYFTQSASEGALPTVRAAVDLSVKGGDFYGPAGLSTLAGPPVKQRSSRGSREETSGALLWQECARLTGVRYLS